MGADLDVTLVSYLTYNIYATASFLSLIVYLFVHHREMRPGLIVFMAAQTINFSSDALSKLWFALWRITGKPLWMVDHAFVEIVTFSAAFAILGSVWFWTNARMGHAFTLYVGAGGLTIAVAIAEFV